tara:strand:- start:4804 stop:5037 length:234 start_codon:yes stop_codon:yes gene_type:complete
MTILSFDLDSSVYDEIRSELARVGRRDLLDELNNAVDPDWKPVRRPKKEPLSDEEGSADSESEYEIHIDEEGFQSLR